MLLFFPIQEHTSARTLTGFWSSRHWSLRSKRGGENSVAQLSAGDGRMCHACRLHKAQRFRIVEMRGVSQAHFVLRGEAVGQVVAFCQQVKIHRKVPTFTTAPAVAPKFSGPFAPLGCGQWAPVGRADAASTVCTDASSLFCGAYCSTLPSPSLLFHPPISLPFAFDAIC